MAVCIECGDVVNCRMATLTPQGWLCVHCGGMPEGTAPKREPVVPQRYEPEEDECCDLPPVERGM